MKAGATIALFRLGERFTSQRLTSTKHQVENLPDNIPADSISTISKWQEVESNSLSAATFIALYLTSFWMLHSYFPAESSLGTLLTVIVAFVLVFLTSQILIIVSIGLAVALQKIGIGRSIDTKWLTGLLIFALITIFSILAIEGSLVYALAGWTWILFIVINLGAAVLLRVIQ